MKLLRVAQEIWFKPWVITPAMHRTISDVVSDHISGKAHSPGGRAEMFPEQEDDTSDEMYSVDSHGIATVNVIGVVGKRLSSFEKMSGATDIEDFTAALNVAVNDSNVRAVLITFDTPGGSVAGIPEAAQQIRIASKKKPVCAFVDGLCCSAGYWLASQVDAIFATESSEVGSIGVYQAFLDQSRNYEMEGYKVELFTTGEYKGMGISGRPLTDAQRDDIQDGVNKVFAWFQRDVRFTRSIPDEDMRGQTWFAQDAKGRGLIEYVGTKSDALEELKARIKEA